MRCYESSCLSLILGGVGDVKGSSLSAECNAGAFLEQGDRKSRGGRRKISPHGSLRVLACCYCHRLLWLALADLPSSDIAACRAGECKGRLITVHVRLSPAVNPRDLSIPGRKEVLPPGTWNKIINFLILVLMLDSKLSDNYPSFWVTLIMIIKTGVKGIVAYEFIWFIYRLIFLFFMFMLNAGRDRSFPLWEEIPLFLVDIITC